MINSHFLKSNNIIFNNNKTLEDVEFTLKLIKYAKNFFLINDKIYNYRISVKDSVSSKIPEKHNYNVDFIKYANHCLLEYNKQTQINVFNNLYKLFLQNLTSSYFYKKINYQELKNIVLTNIDYDIMNEKQSKYFFDLYESINMDSEEIFRKKYYIKFLLKKYFFCGFLLYRSLKTFLFKICYNR